MATTTYGSPYVAGTDLVSGWPTASQNVANRIDDVSIKGNGVNAQTGAGYTLVLTDAGKTVTVSNASAQNLTIPLNASVAFPTGTRITVVNVGSATWTVTGSPTINGTTSIPTLGSVELLKTGTDTWYTSAQGSAVTGSMTLITTQSFTTSSAVNVNNCFTSSYDNYVVEAYFAASTTALDIRCRMRVSAADDSNASYKFGGGIGGSGWTGQGSSGATAFTVTTNQDTTRSFATMKFFGPQTATTTNFSSHAVRPADWYVSIFAGGFYANTQFDGFSLYPASGTITGTLRVYGLKN